MLHKLFVFAAVAAALFISPVAFAKHGHGHKGHGHHHKHGHHYHGHVKNNWNDRINWNAPLRGRWWGGRWWGYGEGACWRWTAGGYIWICR